MAPASRPDRPAAAPGRLVFFGTPAFAVPTLERLAASRYRPALVVSQPPRPAGRGRVTRQPPVARRAAELGLEAPPRERGRAAAVERVRDAAFLDRLEGLAPWVAVVVAFGQIFRRRLLELPAAGCVNLHASLLPRHRGAAPIQAALAAGDRVTGVTTMQMAKGLDSGPVLLQRETAIEPREAAPELSDRLARMGADLMLETLDALASGAIEPRPQDDAAATYAPRLTRDDGRIDWRLEAARIHDRWRAYQPWPGLWCELGGERVTVVACEPLERPSGEVPGTVLSVEPERLAVACGGASTLGLTRLQRPGGRPLPADDFARGRRLAAGDRFA